MANERNDDAVATSAQQAVRGINEGFQRLATAFSGSTATLNADNLTSGTVPAARMPALTGAVTMSAGTTTTAIASDAVTTAKILDLNVTTGKLAANAVTNAKLAQVATATIKGRTTAGTGDPEDLTGAQATALLNNVVGDSGSGGTKGLVPAPGTGDAAARKFLLADATWAKPLVSATKVSASGTSVDFTSIPAWVSRITIMFSDLSTNGTSLLRIRVGTGGTPDTTSYICTSTMLTAGAATSTSTAGWDFYTSVPAAGESRSGHAVLTLMGSNTWVISALIGSQGGTSSTITMGGNHAIAGALDIVRITTVNGTDTFDAGDINILYE